MTIQRTIQGNPELVLKRRPFGSWLLGPADQSPQRLRARLQLLMTTFSIGTNLIGAAVVFVLAVFVLPGPSLVDQLQLLDAILIPAYFVVAMAIGCVWSIRLTKRVTRWIDLGRPATRREQIATLQLPLRLTLIEVLGGLATPLSEPFSGRTGPCQSHPAARLRPPVGSCPAQGSARAATCILSSQRCVPRRVAEGMLPNSLR